MLAVTIVMAVIAAVSAVVAVLALLAASRSADAAEGSVKEAARSADAAERSAASSEVSARAASAEDHRARTPDLTVFVEKKVYREDDSVIYRVRNDGPVDLDSVVVHMPVLGEVEGRIRHQVAATGRAGWADEAEVGPIALTEYGRFTLSLGSNPVLPEFRVKIVCAAGGDVWTLHRLLDNPRTNKPVLPKRAETRGSVRVSVRDTRF